VANYSFTAVSVATDMFGTALGTGGWSFVASLRSPRCGPRALVR
jgi:hypothetical protein